MKDEGLEIGRRKKAKRLADMIRSLDGTVEDAKRLTEDEWRDLDKITRKHTPRDLKPPSAETRALVLEYLARPDDAPKDADVPPAKDDEFDAFLRGVV